jgi:tungstate transport system permease protein
MTTNFPQSLFQAVIQNVSLFTLFGLYTILVWVHPLQGLSVAAFLEILLLSIKVSGIALLLSALIGIPLGVFMGLKHFLGRRLVIALLYTGMGFPPVVIGLFVYLLLSRNGPLGSLNWPWIPSLFTPGAMILAQTIIAFPLVSGFTMAAVMGVDPKLHQQLISLGATMVALDADAACGKQWPACNGSLITGGGDAAVQVAHRMLAYTVAGLALALLVLALRGRGPRLAGSLPLLAVLIQMTLGILIVILGGEGRTHEILQGLHVGGAGTVWAALVALAALSGDPRAERAPRLLTVTRATAG